MTRPEDTPADRLLGSISGPLTGPQGRTQEEIRIRARRNYGSRGGTQSPCCKMSQVGTHGVLVRALGVAPGRSYGCAACTVSVWMLLHNIAHSTNLTVGRH